MTSTILKTLLLGTAITTLAACASVQPSPQIADAQMRLSAAYNDKTTAERGQGDLANAKSALTMAESDWAKGDKEKSDHQLTMAQTYLELAETRGQQAKVEQDMARLTTQAQLSEKDRQLMGKNQQLANKDDLLADKNQQLATRDQELADAQGKLREYDMKVTELGSTMVLQDVSFETGKSVLLPGGVNRLQPLINYLRLSPQTRVRIEGYTDSVGGVAYNQRLSLDRANSVRDTLASGGIDAGRIETVGSGLTKPVATNATVSGRQSNRRVEITLLKIQGT